MSEELVELENLLPKVPSALDRRRIGENLGRAAENLAAADQQIARFLAVVEIANEIGFGDIPGQADTLEELLEEATALARDLEHAQSAEDLNDVEVSYGEFKRLLSTVNRELRLHWQRIAQREFQPLRAIGDLLKTIGIAADLGHRLRECGDDAINIPDRAPAVTLRAEIRRVRSKRAELESERLSLTQDPEIDAFLNALADGSATLNMITERVRIWLDDNDALERFAVSPCSD